MLTDAKVRNAKPRPKAYKIADANDGKNKTMAFGAYPLVSLADAREKRDEAYSILCEGHDRNVAKRLKIESKLEAGRQTFERGARMVWKRQSAVGHDPRKRRDPPSPRGTRQATPPNSAQAAPQGPAGAQRRSIAMRYFARSGAAWQTVAMCNLYTNRKSAAEVAEWFGVNAPAMFNVPEEVVPGYPGMVVREEGGERVLQAMVWGFPLPQKSSKTGLPIKPKPVNNIANLASGMWRNLAPKPAARCLIPLTHFAEPQGEKGSKTRTWISVKGQPIVAWAGIWRQSAEWGPVYSGLMTDCNEVVRPVHDRMPVLLLRDDHDRWLHGSVDDVFAFRDRCFPDELIEIERTAEPWIRR